MVSLPEAFTMRMRGLLGADFPAFADALEHGEPVRGFRINPLKASADILSRFSAFHPTPISYCPGGYRFAGQGIGNAPLHHAGAIYVQDPGAMSALAAVDLHPGDKVADLCAAPGGKSTQIAGAIGENGFLLANEFVPARAKITVGNFERLGLKRAMVTSLDTAVLPSLFSAYFDLVVVDAPCSGEGMFRKDNPALAAWSPDLVSKCAERQKSILENAAPLVRAGGKLLYATCTYAPEEDEEVVAAFLARHPDFTLVPVNERLIPYTAPGVRTRGDMPEEITLCRRFYPHIAPGEGQFVAVMERQKCDDLPTILYKDASKVPDKATETAVRTFLRDNVKDAETLPFRMVSDLPVIVPEGMPVPPRSVFSAGVLLGEVRGKLLFPHHQFFSAFGRDFLRQVSLPETDTRLGAYLRGEEIDGTDVENGFCVVLCEGVPLGGGKAVAGRIKNHYPKGLRL